MKTEKKSAFKMVHKEGKTKVVVTANAYEYQVQWYLNGVKAGETSHYTKIENMLDEVFSKHIKLSKTKTIYDIKNSIQQAHRFIEGFSIGIRDILNER